MSNVVVHNRQNGMLRYYCEGCGHCHAVESKRWNWNGDLQKPTLSPSVRHFLLLTKGGEDTTCHYFIKEGKIRYCNDCKHSKNGQTLPLLPVEDWPE